jgi:hypothetical protein
MRVCLCTMLTERDAGARDLRRGREWHESYRFLEHQGLSCARVRVIDVLIAEACATWPRDCSTYHWRKP